MFNPIEIENKIMAFEKKIHSYHIVYGTRNMKRSDLREIFPQYEFFFIKQQHGVKVVQAQVGPFIEADAHWTNKKNQALAVQTADCIPLFFMREDMICAIHAGWRGVYKKIVPEVLNNHSFFAHPELLVSFGPHILKESFIVDKDVAHRLAESSPHSKKWIQSQREGKYSVSLMHIVYDQICFEIKGAKNHYSFIKNTFLENLFYSFRRDAEKKRETGQISFVVRI